MHVLCTFDIKIIDFQHMQPDQPEYVHSKKHICNQKVWDFPLENQLVVYFYISPRQNFVIVALLAFELQTFLFNSSLKITLICWKTWSLCMNPSVCVCVWACARHHLNSKLSFPDAKKIPS